MGEKGGGGGLANPCCVQVDEEGGPGNNFRPFKKKKNLVVYLKMAFHINLHLLLLLFLFLQGAQTLAKLPRSSVPLLGIQPADLLGQQLIQHPVHVGHVAQQVARPLLLATQPAGIVVYDVGAQLGPVVGDEVLVHVAALAFRRHQALGYEDAAQRARQHLPRQLGGEGGE